MPGNFANTYFATQLAFRNAVVGELNEIDTGRIINVNSGGSTSYSVDDEYTPNNYELYIPAPGILIAANNQSDVTTQFTINNPKGINVEFRVANWFSGPTPYISNNSFPDFTSQTSARTSSDTVILFALYTNPSNPSQKAWFLV